MKRLITVFIVLSIVCICGYSSAAIPHLINYQGKLTDSEGVPLNGTHNITFRIYDQSGGGNLLWTEAHTQAAGAPVTITNGIFSIMLGSLASGLTLPFDQPYWLSIQVGGDPEMTPRQQITSVGYAINSEQVGGKQLSELILVPANSQQGDVLIRDASGWTRLAAGSAGQILKTQGTGANPVWNNNIKVKAGSYIGDSSNNRSITGVGFQPDYIIICASGGAHPVWKIAGMGNYSLLANGYYTNDMIKSFDPDGFTVGTGSLAANGYVGYAYFYFAVKQAN